MASRETWALRLSDEFSRGPAEAFIDDHEFCHVHPAPRGGLHLTLPESIRRVAVDCGWAEEHLGVRGGILPSTLVMVYAPRNDQELKVVMWLVNAARRFAEGGG